MDCVSFSESLFSGGRAEALFVFDLINFSVERFVEGDTGEPCIPAFLLDAMLRRRLNFLFLCTLTLFARHPIPFLAGVGANVNAPVAVIIGDIIKNNVWYCRVQYALYSELIRGILMVENS